MNINSKDIVRFNKKIIKADSGCWLWMGAKSNGYGLFQIYGKSRRAHRISYQINKGFIPDGMTIDHICHNADIECNDGTNCVHRGCVNPNHLEATTIRDNTLRGRTTAALNAQKTHCPKGHEYSDHNTYRFPSGGRRCKKCFLDRCARFRAKNGGTSYREYQKEYMREYRKYNKKLTAIREVDI